MNRLPKGDHDEPQSQHFHVDRMKLPSHFPNWEGNNEMQKGE